MCCDVELCGRLGRGQRQQDVALLAGAALRQIGISLASVVRHPTMMGSRPANTATFYETHSRTAVAVGSAVGIAKR
jgi:hypothetical protein